MYNVFDWEILHICIQHMLRKMTSILTCIKLYMCASFILVGVGNISALLCWFVCLTKYRFHQYPQQCSCTVSLESSYIHVYIHIYCLGFVSLHVVFWPTH